MGAELRPGVERAAALSNVANNGRWLVERVGSAKGDQMDLVRPDGTRLALTSVLAPGQLGRPALDGDRVVFHKAVASGSKLLEFNLATGVVTTLRATSTGVLLNPVLSGEGLLYVHSTFEWQRLMSGSRTGAGDGGDDRVQLSMVPTARRDSGHEPGRHRHSEGYRNGFGRHLPQRPRPGVVQTLWEPAFAGVGRATVTRLDHGDDGGVAVETLAVTLR